ncbi:OmpA family protein [Myxococcota bacterium]|nr:OmpA family protein [Myxococcota bacterium]
MHFDRWNRALLATMVLVGAGAGTGCVSKAKYAELEGLYLAEQKARADLEGRAAALEEQLRGLASQYDELKVQVSRLQDEAGVQVRLADSALFELGSADLSEQGKEILRQVASTVRDDDRFVMRVIGHADSVPITGHRRFTSNWELSADRAAHVAEFLQDEAGIPGYRLVVAGYSDQRPEAANAEEGTSDNRRVDLVIAPFTADDRLAGRPGKVEIDTADAARIAFVLGVDRAVAEGIVRYRATAGRIESVDELLGVEGVDAAALERVRDRIILGGGL